MEIKYVTKLQKQPLSVDLSENYYEGGILVHHPYFFIFWDGEQVSNKWGDTVWKYKSVCIEGPIIYETIIRAIVRYKYTADEVEAILLNAQLPQAAAGDKYSEYRAELAGLQAWRCEAKEVAGRVLENLDNNT